MSSSNPNRPRAKRVWFEQELLYVQLEHGRTLAAEFKGFPRLAQATEAQRNQWRLIGRGVGIHWPEIDEDLSTDGLLRDALWVKAKTALAG